MAAGADESPRGTAAPAHECGKGSAALLSHLQVLTPFNRRNLRLHPSAFEMPKLRSPPVGLFFFLVPRSSDENEMRKGFTVSERVAIGEAMEKELQGRVGNPQLKAANVENFPPLQPEGKTRDLVAKATGFGNGKTLALNSGNLPTDCRQARNRKRVHYYFHSNEPLSVLVPER